MKRQQGYTYQDVGVLTNEELGLNALLGWVRRTEDFRKGQKTGKSVLDIGYFANVIDLGHGVGLAISTDGVGTKILIAEMVGRYDTIGIDCVAMNVNDVLCVGAEPISMLDYIAIEKATPDILQAIGQGLYEGAKQAGISIVGGEIAQIAEMVRGIEEEKGLDLVGMCVGIVPIDKVNIGQSVTAGDVIVGLRSSGIHSNGLTLARHTLLTKGKLKVDTYVPDLQRTVGEELLVPTHIYVPEVLDLLRQDLPLKALVNITSDGFLNLTRIQAKVGFNITNLPEPHLIFKLIQGLGNIDDAEMYRVFNMGIGFCVIAPNDGKTPESIITTAYKYGIDAYKIGEVINDPEKNVSIPQVNLVGQGDRFHSAQ
jgi:phosphoribosylformylglycinamidine cyclo-ligase